MKILLISHGDFAAGMCKTLHDFFGAENVYAAWVTQENGTADLMSKARAYLEQWTDEQVVVCSDLKGGSANQSALELLARPDTYLISGMNLSLVLQLQMEDQVDAETIQEIIANAKEDMVLVNELLNAQADNDEDE